MFRNPEHCAYISGRAMQNRIIWQIGNIGACFGETLQIKTYSKGIILNCIIRHQVVPDIRAIPAIIIPVACIVIRYHK